MEDYEGFSWDLLSPGSPVDDIRGLPAPALQELQLGRVRHGLPAPSLLVERTQQPEAQKCTEGGKLSEHGCFWSAGTGRL